MPKAPIDIDTADQIVLMIEETSRDQFCVRAIDLHITAMKIRFSADRTNLVEEVFQSDAASLVRSICIAALRDREIDLQSLCPVEICGLAVSDIGASISRSDQELRQVDVRLRVALGNVIALFRASPSEKSGLSLFKSRIIAGPGHQLDSDRLLDDMLSQLYLPLVNLNAFLRQLLEGQSEAPKEALASSVIQLKTKAEVLQFAFDRLISGMVIDNLAAPPAPPRREPAERRIAGVR